MKILEFNAATGETTERQLTQEEIDAMQPTEKEVKSWIEEEKKRRQQEAIERFKEKQVLETVQALTDEEAIEFQDVYPLWEVGLSVKVDEKYQHFNAENEVVLYKVVQAHKTQGDWKPKDTPALFVRVGYDGEILDWKQPTGAHDAYQIGDKVK